MRQIVFAMGLILSFASTALATPAFIGEFSPRQESNLIGISGGILISAGAQPQFLIATNTQCQYLSDQIMIKEMDIEGVLDELQNLAEQDEADARAELAHFQMEAEDLSAQLAAEACEAQ